jgi:hypothetical protein
MVYLQVPNDIANPGFLTLHVAFSSLNLLLPWAFYPRRGHQCPSVVQYGDWVVIFTSLISLFAISP